MLPLPTPPDTNWIRLVWHSGPRVWDGGTLLSAGVPVPNGQVERARVSKRKHLSLGLGSALVWHLSNAWFGAFFFFFLPFCHPVSSFSNDDTNQISTTDCYKDSIWYHERKVAYIKHLFYKVKLFTAKVITITTLTFIHSTNSHWSFTKCRSHVLFDMPKLQDLLGLHSTYGLKESYL